MMDAMDIQAVESKLNDVTVTAIPMPSHNHHHHHQTQPHNYSTTPSNRHFQQQHSKPLHPAHQNHLHHKSHHHQTGAHNYQSAVPQPAHQSSFVQQQPPQYNHKYPNLISPSSPHVSMVPSSQHSPAISATRISTVSPADFSAPVSLTVTTLMPSSSAAAAAGNGSSSSSLANASGLTKYAQLLSVIEEMGRDIRPTYSGSRSSAERLKRGIVHARILVRECLVETERSARQN